MKKFAALALLSTTLSGCLLNFTKEGYGLGPPRYVQGTVMHEQYIHFLGHVDWYKFSIKTDVGMKVVTLGDDDDSSTLNVLLDPADTIKFRLRKMQFPERTKFRIDLEQVVEINGVPFEVPKG